MTKKRELKPQWSWLDYCFVWMNTSFIFFVACKRSRWFLWYNRILVICASGSQTWLVKKNKNINIVHTREYWKVLGPTKIPYQKKNLMIYHQIRETGRTENFPANPRTFYFVLFIFDHWCHFYLFCILFHIIIVWCKFCKYWNRFSSEDFKPLFYFGHTFKN